MKKKILLPLFVICAFAVKAQENKDKSSIGPPQVKTVEAIKTPDTAGLKAGQQCPDISFKDVNGKEMKLSQFKGKYVYIDIWASWCYPCRKEYPVLKAMTERMSDKNIVFVGISCDERDFRWKAAMGFEKMTGIQWIINDQKFMKAFQVGTVPRYILLNKEGVIIDPRMSRPSDEKTEKALNTLKNI